MGNTMSYFRSINQEVLVSSQNSDTSNLPVGGYFIGTGVSTLGVNAIQVNLKADQNCTLYVDQGPDTSSWPLTDSFNYYNGKGGNSWTIQATDSYTRVRVQNTGTASTTTKYLSTCLCPIVDPIPRALSSEGNLKVGVYEIEGDFGTKVLVDQERELKTASAVRLVGASFTDTTDTNFWTYAGTGSGSASQSGGQLTLSTGGTASSTMRSQSVRVARYVGGSGNYYHGQIQCPTQSGSCIRRWGAFDTTNGYFFQYDGTNITPMYRKSGVDTTVTAGTFNGNWGGNYTLDGNCHTYDIHWTTKKIGYFIGDEILHSLDATATTLVGTPSLSISIECNNGTGNTSNNSLIARSSVIDRLGQANTRPKWWYQHGATSAATVLKYGPGTLQRVTVNGWVTGSTVTLYDSLTTTSTIALIAPTTNGAGNANQPFYMDFNLDFYTGLTVAVVNGSTDVTVIYE
jgi:hypothetical protein